ncbi:MAG: hypothetical protein ACJ762_11405 [Solirubrobacteraceae bacterium]
MTDAEPTVGAHEMALGPLTQEDVDLVLEAFEGQPNETYKVETGDAGEHRAYDPGTLIVVVLVSNAAIGALATFLAKRRKSSSFEYTLEITKPDGSVRRERLAASSSESEAPSAEFVTQLAQLTRQETPPQLGEPS